MVLLQSDAGAVLLLPISGQMVVIQIVAQMYALR